MTKKTEDTVVETKPVEVEAVEVPAEVKEEKRAYMVTLTTPVYRGFVEFENAADAAAFLTATQEALRTSPVLRWSSTVVVRSHEVAVELDEVIG